MTVLQLARDLGMARRGDPLKFLVAHCRQRVEAWAVEFGAETLDDVLRTVAAKVGLVIEYVETDRQMSELATKYLAKGEGGFARVPDELDAKTFALVFRLRQPQFGCSHVAVIDCRGRKGARRWFSTWHEIAHLLVQPQLSFNFRRTRADEQDPVEAAMDAIAGELGYLDTFYRLEVRAGERISLAVLEAHRVRVAPQASLQSAYGTAVARLATPALLVVAEPGLKVAERRAITRGASAGSAPEPKLRAVSVIGSPSAAAAGLFIPTNLRVPRGSVIYRAFYGAANAENMPVVESLALWESGGRHLETFKVQVEATKFGERVLALVVPR